MGGKTYYNVKDYSLWVAALSPMLDELSITLPPAVEHLRQAARCPRNARSTATACSMASGGVSKGALLLNLRRAHTCASPRTHARTHTHAPHRPAPPSLHGHLP